MKTGRFRQAPAGILFIIPLMLLIGLIQQGHAQITPRFVEAEAGFFSTLSGERHQAFWLVHNRWGRFDEGSANAMAFVSASKEIRADRLIDWGGGLTLLARGAGHSTAYFHEGYLQAGLGIFRMEAGRWERTYGHTYERLSSGSAGVSPNASPVPRILLAVPEFEPVPLTAGWLEFKGHLSHGWFGGDREIRDTWLHDKSFYLQTGADTGVKFYTGLVHFAEWSGVRPNGSELPRSFADFLRVFVAGEGDRAAPGGDQVNALGAHYGLWDWGLRAGVADLDLHVYYQHLFSDASGLLYRNLRDGFYGIGLSNPSGSGLLTGVLWEFLYTKHQTGPGLTDPQSGDSPDFCGDLNPNCGYRFNGRDDYYNNFYYLSGWAHHSRAIGNPLFLTRTQLDRVDPAVETYNERYFAGTRVAAHHIGLEGRLHRNVPYRFFTTYTRHYGTYPGLNLGDPWGSLDPDLDPEAYFFNPPRHQWYFMLETRYLLPRSDGVSVHASIALDRGDLFNNAGVMAGVTWQLW